MKNLFLLPTLLSLLLIACGSQEPQSKNKQQDTQTSTQGNLNIYNWSDYVDPDTVLDFENKHHIKIRYDYYDSNEALEAKILTGRSGYDLVFPGSANINKQIIAGAYLPIDKSKIPNYQNLDPVLMNLLQSIDPNNQFVIPYFLGTNTVGINLEKVTEILGEPLPKNEWDLVFNPQYTQKLKQCGISFLDSPSEIFPLALRYLGKDPMGNSAEDIKAAAELIKSIRPHIKRFSSSGYINELARGELCVAIGYGGDINIARNRAIEAGSHFEIKALPASNGAAIWIDSMAIPQDAEHIESAYQYINYVLDPEVAAKNGNYVTYAPSSSPAKALMDKEYTENRSIFPSQEDIEKGFIIKTFEPKLLRLSVQLWQKIKAGQ